MYCDDGSLFIIIIYHHYRHYRHHIRYPVTIIVTSLPSLPSPSRHHGYHYRYHRHYRRHHHCSQFLMPSIWVWINGLHSSLSLDNSSGPLSASLTLVNIHVSAHYDHYLSRGGFNRTLFSHIVSVICSEKYRICDLSSFLRGNAVSVSMKPEMAFQFGLT